MAQLAFDPDRFTAVEENTSVPFDANRFVDVESEPLVGSVFGKVSESDYAAGERNIIGNIFERPAAAVRSAIQGKGYAQGAINPTGVETFQNLTLNNYYNGVSNVASMIPEGVGRNAFTTLGSISGLVPSTAGVLADMITDPSNLLMGFGAELPATKSALSALSKTKGGASIGKVLNAKIMPTTNDVNAFKTDVAEKVMNSLIKPLKKDFAYGKRPGRTVAKEGIIGNSLDELATNISKRKDEYGAQIGEKIKNVKTTDDYSKVTSPIDKAIAQLQKTPRTNANAINRLTDAKKDLLGIKEFDGVVIAQDDITKLTPLQAFELKTRVADMTKWTGNASDDKVINQALQKTYREIKHKLNRNVDGLRPLNEKYADLLTALNATKYREAISNRNNVFGLNDRIAGGFAGVPAFLINHLTGTPAFKTRVSAWLAKAPEQRAAEVSSDPEFGKAVQRFLVNRKSILDAENFKTDPKPLDLAQRRRQQGGQIQGLPKEAEAQRRVSNLGFYSKAEEVINTKIPNAVNKDQLIATLKSNGVKDEEISQLGLDALEGKVSKSDLQTLVKANQVPLEEKVLAQEQRVLTSQEESRLKELQARNSKKPLGAIDDDESGSWNELLTLENIKEKSTNDQLLAKSKEYEDMARQAQRVGNKKLADKYWERSNHYTARNEELQLSPSGQGGLTNNTKFGQYQLPGGENYREVLLKMPAQKGLSEEVISDLMKEYKLSRQQVINDVQSGNIQLNADDTRAMRKQGTFTSSHFDDPNILVHARINDRTVNGKKTLFIEEIQSDWHQKGRKEGYQQKPLTELPEGYKVEKVPAKLPGITSLPAEAKTQFSGGTWIVEYNRHAVGEGYDQASAVNNAIRNLGKETYIVKSPQDLYVSFRSDTPAEAIQDALKGLNKPKPNVPDAPFKKTWHELMFKRILDKAVKENYDSVAWTTGEQQAERYRLSKQVDSIAWNAAPDEPTYVLIKTKDAGQINVTLDKSGTVTDARPNSGGNIIGKDIEDVVGKEVGGKIKTEMSGELSGEGLDVGGSGMKGFYDQILPSYANKYAKKWGGRVGKTDIGRPVGRTEPDIFGDEQLVEQTGIEDQIVHSLAITPAMRSEIKRGGQPLFQAATVGTAGLGLMWAGNAQASEKKSIIDEVQRRRK